MSLESLLINSVIVRRASYSNDRGQRVASYTESVISMSVQPTQPAATDAHGLESAERGWTAYCDHDPGVKRGDLLLFGTRTLEVLGPANDQAGRGRVFVVACREVA
jgi:hypothetical protein